MKRHRTWYRRELFKNHFKSYKDWDDFNPPSGDKCAQRYKNEALQCQNPKCAREGMFISEHEAYYYYAKQSKIKIITSKIMFMLRKSEKNSLYVCPFCGKDDVQKI
ncbi:hypothetical protein K0B03_00935 [Patescibacteria group bacterium]|nr:hypothetical protein [Patescibacteria group bacterium]